MKHKLARFLAVGMMAAALMPGAAFAQGQQPQPVDQSAEFAAVRSQFETMTEAQLAAAGYVANPRECVTAASAGLPAELGAMGIHAENRTLYGQQFPTGVVSADNPPIVLLDPSGKVVGLEWEVSGNVTPEPELFGQTFPLLPGHPGVPEPHYMLHAYFYPKGQVLFATWNPNLSCAAGNDQQGGNSQTGGNNQQGGGQTGGGKTGGNQQGGTGQTGQTPTQLPKTGAGGTTSNSVLTLASLAALVVALTAGLRFARGR